MAQKSEFIDTHLAAKLIGKPESFLRNARSINGPANGYHGPPHIKDPATGKVRYRRAVIEAWLSRRHKGERG